MSLPARRLFTLALLAPLVTGCSFVGVERLPSGYRRDQLPTCSEGRLAVAVDAVLAGLTGLAAAAMINGAPEEPEPAEVRGLGITYGVLGVLLASSAGYGVHEDQRCGRARAEHRGWLDEPGRSLPPGAIASPSTPAPAVVP